MKKIWNNQIIKLVMLVLLSLILSLLVEACCMLVASNFSSLYHEFNFARYFFFCGIGLTAILIYYIYKERIKQIETIFLIISLIVGSVMILSSPFGHICWDLESHFKSVVSYASFDGKVTESEEIFINVDEGSWFKHSYIDNQNLINKVNSLDSSLVDKSYNSYIISHLPGAIVYDIGKLLGLPFNIKVDLVRFCYLFLYSIICYFAIRKLKTNKLIFSTIGLFPACLFMASNITYDWWIISFTMLGIAYFYSEYQQPDKKMKTYEIIIMLGSLLLGCIIKAVYFLLLVIPMFMKKSYFKKDNKERWKYYSLVVLFFILLFSVFMTSYFGISSQGDIKGGDNVNPVEQLAFIFSNPVKYAIILADCFTQYLSLGNLSNMTSSFSHLSSGAHLTMARDFGIFIIIAVVLTVIDRNNFDKLTTTWKFKILTTLIFFISVILIITALYISFNNVGESSISGVQSRYLIPLLSMLLPALGFARTNQVKNWPSRKIKFSYALIVSLVLFWDIAHVMLLQLL